MSLVPANTFVPVPEKTDFTNEILIEFCQSRLQPESFPARNLSITKICPEEFFMMEGGMSFYVGGRGAFIEICCMEIEEMDFSYMGGMPIFFSMKEHAGTLDVAASPVEWVNAGYERLSPLNLFPELSWDYEEFLGVLPRVAL